MRIDMEQAVPDLQEEAASAPPLAEKQQDESVAGEPQVRWELYNLAADKEETTDVVEANAELVAELQGELSEWLESVVDSFNGEDY